MLKINLYCIRACLIIKLYTHICPQDPGLAPEVVSQGQCGLWGAHTRKVRSWQRYFLEPESVFLQSAAFLPRFQMPSQLLSFQMSSWSTSGFAGFLHGDGVSGAAKGDD